LTNNNRFTYNSGSNNKKRDKAKPVERQGRKATDLNRQPGCLGKEVARLFCFPESNYKYHADRVSNGNQIKKGYSSEIVPI